MPVMTEDAYPTVATPTEGETESPVTLIWLGSDGAGEDLTGYTVKLIGKKDEDGAVAFTDIAGTLASQGTSAGQVAFDFASVSSAAGSSGTYLCQMKRTRVSDSKVTHSQQQFQIVVRKSAAVAA